MLPIHKLAAAAIFLAVDFLTPASTLAQHQHSAPEKLGKVNFPVSCARSVQSSFNHAVALLHSFAYSSAQQEFAAIAQRDPQCAMAHWGVAISYYHQLWDPPILPSNLPIGAAEIQKAQDVSEHASDREQAFIHALAVFYATASHSSVRLAALAYTNAMRDAATQNLDDTESQVFYALSFLAIASPTDPAHTNQKVAAMILEPLFRRYPGHPGLAHYLIHAYDHPDLARLGLPAARAYCKIAPSAPHALHMPSHVFTLLGLWPDSIQSNLAARAAARRQDDIGEELHSMDYLLYAYLQAGRFADAEQLLADLRKMQGLPTADYKVAYAAAIMPARYAVERRQWNEAMKIFADANAPPQFRAIAEWANTVAASHAGNIPDAELHFHSLQELLAQTRRSADEYWSTQVRIEVSEAEGWLEHARGNDQQSATLLRAAADQEDQFAKRPITPGPVIPAREQLADLLLEGNNPAAALREYESSLQKTPGRRNALAGAARAADLSGDSAKAQQFNLQLNALH